jgi:hypothetical protein
MWSLETLKNALRTGDAWHRREYAGYTYDGRNLHFVVLREAESVEDVMVLALDEPLLGRTLTMGELEETMYSTSAYNIEMINYTPLGSDLLLP